MPNMSKGFKISPPAQNIVEKNIKSSGAVMLAQLRVTVAAGLCRVVEFLIRIMRISAGVTER